MHILGRYMSSVAGVFTNMKNTQAQNNNNKLYHTKTVVNQ